MTIKKNDPQPAEQQAITTTIVGGRPPGCGQSVGEIPRGIEVLVKKAAVDAEFRELLLDKRAAAATQIDLTLEPAEAMMLDGVPREQLEQIIDGTRVKPEHRAALLGKVAAFMLAALGMQTLSCDCDGPPAPTGIRPDKPPENARPLEDKEGAAEALDNILPRPTTKGIRPDRPPENKDATSRGIRPDRP